MPARLHRYNLTRLSGKYKGPVSGNNKARVIATCCHGVKTFRTLWNRLVHDLNRAFAAVSRSIAELCAIVSSRKVVLLTFRISIRKRPLYSRHSPLLKETAQEQKEQ